jgi:hypothetical protein
MIAPWVVATWLLCGFVGATAAALGDAAPPPPLPPRLPPVHIDPAGITVSGISSGAVRHLLTHYFVLSEVCCLSSD